MGLESLRLRGISCRARIFCRGTLHSEKNFLVSVSFFFSRRTVCPKVKIPAAKNLRTVSCIDAIGKIVNLPPPYLLNHQFKRYGGP